jgi:hypothetical protein
MLRIRSVTLNHLREAASCPEHLNDATGQWSVIAEYASQRERATFEGIRIPRSFYETKS